MATGVLFCAITHPIHERRLRKYNFCRNTTTLIFLPTSMLLHMYAYACRVGCMGGITYINSMKPLAILSPCVVVRWFPRGVPARFGGDNKSRRGRFEGIPTGVEPNKSRRCVFEGDRGRGGVEPTPAPIPKAIPRGEWPENCHGTNCLDLGGLPPKPAPQNCVPPGYRFLSNCMGGRPCCPEY